MAKDWIVISCEEPLPESSVDGMQARIEMRFYEQEAAEKFAQGQSSVEACRRFYVLHGASIWYRTNHPSGSE